MTDGPRVELIFDATCPNVETARRQVGEALARVGRPPVWIEWDRAAPDSPPYARRYASPTVLVDGRDVAGAVPVAAGAGCRVYTDATGTLVGAPGTVVILAALVGAGAVFE